MKFPWQIPSFCMRQLSWTDLLAIDTIFFLSLYEVNVFSIFVVHPTTAWIEWEVNGHFVLLGNVSPFVSQMNQQKCSNKHESINVSGGEDARHFPEKIHMRKKMVEMWKFLKIKSRNFLLCLSTRYHTRFSTDQSTNFKATKYCKKKNQWLQNGSHHWVPQFHSKKPQLYWIKQNKGERRKNSFVFFKPLYCPTFW